MSHQQSTLFVFLLFLSYSSTLQYPMFKQCDSRWAQQQLGTSPTQTICSAGCLLSSVSMALNAIGNTQINPSYLNRWLKDNKGYASDDLLIWGAVQQFGVRFEGKVRREQIKGYLDAGYIVVPNVNNGKHWVLATGKYDGDNIMVNDPNHPYPSYPLDQIVEGNTGIYSITRLQENQKDKENRQETNLVKQ